MDITFLAIAFFILLAILMLILLLFKSINIKRFNAEDGSIFDKQEDLEVYENLYNKTKPIFSVKEGQNGNSILGFETSFLIKLTDEGFQDLKTLIKYRKQFKILLDLINS